MKQGEGFRFTLTAIIRFNNIPRRLIIFIRFFYRQFDIAPNIKNSASEDAVAR
jgi:hypothetical protein